MIVVGVDPGLNGAMAVLDPHRGALLELVDVPTYTTIVSGKQRRRLDEDALLHEAARIRRDYGDALAVIENVHSQPGNGHAQAFAYGRAFGALVMAFKGCRYRVEFVEPSAWKKAMRVPAKLDSKKLAGAICARANELFPNDKHRWHGPKGGYLHDRAEAAMIAKYGAEKWILRVI